MRQYVCLVALPLSCKSNNVCWHANAITSMFFSWKNLTFWNGNSPTFQDLTKANFYQIEHIILWSYRTFILPAKCILHVKCTHLMQLSTHQICACMLDLWVMVNIILENYYQLPTLPHPYTCPLCILVPVSPSMLRDLEWFISISFLSVIIQLQTKGNPIRGTIWYIVVCPSSFYIEELKYRSIFGKVFLQNHITR